jgi:hypothetical protein
MEFIKKNKSLLIVITASIFALKPLFNSGYFTVHDNLQVERIYQMSQALKDGHFPVRWVKDLGYGYGYPLFNYYAPLPYYIGSIFNILGFNLIVSTKIMFGVGILLAGISMYFLGRKLWGNWGGLLSAILYQYLPYHAVQIYVRGSVGEYWAYALLPLLSLALMKRRTFLGGIVFFAIILSHNISALLITGFIIITTILHSIVVFFRNHSLPRNFYLLFIAVIGLSLSAFFWLPAFVEKDLTQVNKVIQGGSYYADHFVQLSQLWSSPWGYGGSAPPSKIDGMSFKLGKLHVLLAMAATLLVLWNRRKEKYPLLITHYSLLAASIFMMLSISKPIWDIFPILRYIQFPWRLLMFAGFSLSVLGGGILYIARGAPKAGKTVFLLVVAFLVIMNIRVLPSKLEIAHFKPVNNFQASDKNFISEDNLKWEASKRSDEYVPIGFNVPRDASQIALTRLSRKQKNKIEITQDKTHVLTFLSNFTIEQDVIVNIAYFPGWEVYIDGLEKEIIILDRGFMISIPPGKHEVVIKFENTKVRKIANLITLLSLLFVSGIFVRRKWLNGYMAKWLNG